MRFYKKFMHKMYLTWANIKRKTNGRMTWTYYCHQTEKFYVNYKKRCHMLRCLSTYELMNVRARVCAKYLGLFLFIRLYETAYPNRVT